MFFKELAQLQKTIRGFHRQALEYERRTSASMAISVAAVFFIYGILFWPVSRMDGVISLYVYQDLIGMGLIILVSLAYAWKMRKKFSEKQLSHMPLWGFGYHSFLLLTIFYLWITGSNISITPLFILIIGLGFTWLHITQYILYISILLTLILIAISLVEFDYFWFLEFIILYLFAVSLHLFHVRQQCQLFQYQQAIEQERNHDTLTGLLNRRALEEKFSGGRSTTPMVAAILVDLDHFKQINDSMGHTAGDQALSETAALFRRIFRRDDLIARIGGDEFLILLRLPQDAERILTIKLQNLLKHLPVCFSGSYGSGSVSCSIGAYLCKDQEENDLEFLMSQADSAMYQVKENGRNGAMIHTEDGKQIRLP